MNERRKGCRVGSLVLLIYRTGLYLAFHTDVSTFLPARRFAASSASL